MGGHRERKPDIHPARITFYRRVQKTLNLRKRHNLIKSHADIRPRHSEDRSVEIDVLAPRELRMETGAHFEKTREASFYGYSSLAWLRDTRKNFKECAFSRPVPPDDPDDLARLNRKSDVFD